MKKSIYVMSCAVFILFFLLCFNFENNIAVANFQNNNIEVSFQIDNKKYTVNNEKCNNVCLTNMQQCNQNLKKDDVIKNMTLLKQSGFDERLIVKYTLPFLYYKTNKILDGLIIKPQNAFLSSKINTCTADYNYSKNGLYLDKNKIFLQIYYNLVKNMALTNFTRNTWEPSIKTVDLCKFSYCRGCYATNFSSSSSDRKCNIILALKKLNNTIISPGEEFSFNTTVGERLERFGYKKAKIIKNNKFVEAVGGGVCQVSTTLYNAVLRAGLKIVELHPHSLKVGYVEPGFDAMVNMGSSDLRFFNNTNYPILISTSYINDECKIYIFGEKNSYKYVPYSVVCESSDSNNQTNNFEMVDAFVKVYDESNNFIKENKIRHIKYSVPLL